VALGFFDGSVECVTFDVGNGTADTVSFQMQHHLMKIYLIHLKHLRLVEPTDDAVLDLVYYDGAIIATTASRKVFSRSPKGWSSFNGNEQNLFTFKRSTLQDDIVGGNVNGPEVD